MPSATLADDSYHRLTDLLGIARTARLTEAFLSAVTNGLIWRYGDNAQPAATDPGTEIGSGGSVGLGPVRGPALAWDANRMWVRNATGGANATVVLNATFTEDS